MFGDVPASAHLSSGFGQIRSANLTAFNFPCYSGHVQFGFGRGTCPLGLLAAIEPLGGAVKQKVQCTKKSICLANKRSNQVAK